MDLTGKAKALRRNQTDVERLLWNRLRNRHLLDCKFRRQFPVEHYIVDFVCLESKLIIELDGSQHFDQIDYDQHRTAELEQRGFRLIRFWNNDVIENMEGVMAKIMEVILDVQK